jgi:hypothetical protein
MLNGSDELMPSMPNEPTREPKLLIREVIENGERVVKVSDGVFEVTFPYESPEEIERQFREEPTIPMEQVLRELHEEFGECDDDAEADVPRLIMLRRND